MNLQTVRRWFPVILAGISILVFIRLGCDVGCGNITELQNATAPHPSMFQSFLNLWSFSG